MVFPAFINHLLYYFKNKKFTASLVRWIMTLLRPMMFMVVHCLYGQVKANEEEKLIKS